MRLTQKLLAYLNRVFDKSPAQFLALRLQYAGGMTWQVADGMLTTTIVGGPGQPLAVDLTQYTLGQLYAFLAAQPGYSVAYGDQSALSPLSSRVLLDGTGDISLSNGDHLYGYTSLLWSYLEAQAVELQAAENQIAEALEQMSTKTASNEWLDEIGGYYAVPRMQGELDASYGPRIIAEVLRPRGNNVAIEAAIKVFTGQAAKVTDVTLYGSVFPLYNGAIKRNSAYHYNATRAPLYGLFDVEYGYNFETGSDITQFAQTVSGLIGRLRDAGTHLRSLLLRGSNMADTLAAPDDTAAVPWRASAALSDALIPPDDSRLAVATVLAGLSEAFAGASDTTTLSIAYSYRYNSVRHYNSAIYRMGVSTLPETI